MISIAAYTLGSISAGGLRAALHNHKLIRLSGTFANLEELEAHVRDEAPEVILLEITHEIDLNRLNRLVSLSPGTAAVLWFDTASESFLMQGLAAGARGLLSRNSSIEAHVNCLLEVAGGGLWFDRGAAKDLFSVRTVRLAPRERQLMGLVAQGLSNKEIAWSLSIAEGTVKVYLSHLFEKLGVNDRLELALIALKNIHASETYFAAAPRVNGEKVTPLYVPPQLCVRRGAMPGLSEEQQNLTAA